jgi:hypothetical protein
MATHTPVADVDYADHLQTYQSFVRGVIYAVAAAAITLILLAYFLL